MDGDKPRRRSPSELLMDRVGHPRLGAGRPHPEPATKRKFSNNGQAVQEPKRRQWRPEAPEPIVDTPPTPADIAEETDFWTAVLPPGAAHSSTRRAELSSQLGQLRTATGAGCDSRLRHPRAAAAASGWRAAPQRSFPPSSGRLQVQEISSEQWQEEQDGPARQDALCQPAGAVLVQEADTDTDSAPDTPRSPSTPRVQHGDLSIVEVHFAEEEEQEECWQQETHEAEELVVLPQPTPGAATVMQGGDERAFFSLRASRRLMHPLRRCLSPMAEESCEEMEWSDSQCVETKHESASEDETTSSTESLPTQKENSKKAWSGSLPKEPLVNEDVKEEETWSESLPVESRVREEAGEGKVWSASLPAESRVREKTGEEKVWSASLPVESRVREEAGEEKVWSASLPVESRVREKRNDEKVFSESLPVQTRVRKVANCDDALRDSHSAVSGVEDETCSEKPQSHFLPVKSPSPESVDCDKVHCASLPAVSKERCNRRSGQNTTKGVSEGVMSSCNHSSVNEPHDNGIEDTARTTPSSGNEKRHRTSWSLPGEACRQNFRISSTACVNGPDTNNAPASDADGKVITRVSWSLPNEARFRDTTECAESLPNESRKGDPDYGLASVSALTEVQGKDAEASDEGATGSIRPRLTRERKTYKNGTKSSTSPPRENRRREDEASRMSESLPNEARRREDKVSRMSESLPNEARRREDVVSQMSESLPNEARRRGDVVSRISESLPNEARRRDDVVSRMSESLPNEARRREDVVSRMSESLPNEACRRDGRRRHPDEALVVESGTSLSDEDRQEIAKNVPTEITAMLPNKTRTRSTKLAVPDSSLSTSGEQAVSVKINAVNCRQNSQEGTAKDAPSSSGSTSDASSVEVLDRTDDKRYNFSALRMKRKQAQMAAKMKKESVSKAGATRKARQGPGIAETDKSKTKIAEDLIEAETLSVDKPEPQEEKYNSARSVTKTRGTPKPSEPLCSAPVSRTPQEIISDMETEAGWWTVRPGYSKETDDHDQQPDAAPAVVTPLSDLECYVTETLILEAEVNGHPWPEARWVIKPFLSSHQRSSACTNMDGQLIETGEQRLVQRRDHRRHRLVIPRISYIDAGRYAVSFRNAIDEALSQCNVVVKPLSELKAPHFFTPLVAKTVCVGEKVEFRCEVRGSPLPSVAWLKDSTELVPGPAVLMTHKLTTGLCSLTLLEVGAEHSGVYTCRASNQHGHTEAQTTLQVQKHHQQHPEAIDAEPTDGTPHPIPVSLSVSRPQPAELLPSPVPCNPTGTAPSVASYRPAEQAPSVMPSHQTEVAPSAGPPQPNKVTPVDDPHHQAETPLSSLSHPSKGHPCVTSSHPTELPPSTSSSHPTKVAPPTAVHPGEQAKRSTCRELTPPVETRPLGICRNGSSTGGASLPSNRLRATIPPPETRLQGEHARPDGNSETPRDGGRHRPTTDDEDGGADTTDTHSTVLPPADGPRPESTPEEVAVVERRPFWPAGSTLGQLSPFGLWQKDSRTRAGSARVKAMTSPEGEVALEVADTTPEDVATNEVQVAKEDGEVINESEVAAEAEEPAPSNKEPSPAKEAQEAPAEEAPAAKEPPAAEEAPSVLAPSVEEALAPVQAVAGCPGRLEGRVSGLPKPTVAWTRDGAPVRADGERVKQYHEDNGTFGLEIAESRAEDVGMYKATAVNSAGQASTEATFELLDTSTTGKEWAPDFTTPLLGAKVDEGGAIQLDTHVTGVPIPEISWTKDGVPLDGDERVVTGFDSDKATLSIEPATMSDAGKYEITIRNKLGELSSAVQVKVNKIYSLPQFTEKLKDQQQLPSLDVKFSCRVSAVPKPEVQWLFNDKPLKSSKKHKVRRDEEACTLSVRECDTEDAGTYTCRATNCEGSVDSSAALSVVDKLEKKPKLEAPLFLKAIGDCEVFPGMQARFTGCIAGYPEPECQWYRNDVRIYPSDRIVVEADGSGLVRLTLRTVDETDAGRYRLKIWNSEGEAACEADLTYDSFENTPSKPLKDQYQTLEKQLKSGIPMPLADPPIISRMSDRQLTLSWKPSPASGHHIPPTYTVEMAKMPEGGFAVINTGVRGCSVEIKRLEPQCDYKFRVIVENKHGASEPSPHTVAHRVGLVPAPPPENPCLEECDTFRADSSHLFPRGFDMDKHTAGKGHPPTNGISRPAAGEAEDDGSWRYERFDPDAHTARLASQRLVLPYPADFHPPAVVPPSTASRPTRPGEPQPPAARLRPLTDDVDGYVPPSGGRPRRVAHGEEWEQKRASNIVERLLVRRQMEEAGKSFKRAAGLETRSMARFMKPRASERRWEDDEGHDRPRSSLAGSRAADRPSRNFIPSRTAAEIVGSDDDELDVPAPSRYSRPVRHSRAASVLDEDFDAPSLYTGASRHTRAASVLDDEDEDDDDLEILSSRRRPAPHHARTATLLAAANDSDDDMTPYLRRPPRLLGTRDWGLPQARSVRATLSPISSSRDREYQERRERHQELLNSRNRDLSTPAAPTPDWQGELERYMRGRGSGVGAKDAGSVPTKTAKSLDKSSVRDWESRFAADADL